MKIKAPVFTDTVEFVVFAPSGGFKLRYAQTPEYLDVPDDVQVIVCKWNRIPALGWSLKSPVWSTYDELYHCWTPEPPKVELPAEPPTVESRDEFSGSLLTPPKEIKSKKRLHKPLEVEVPSQNESPFPSLEVHRYPGPELEKRYIQ